MPTDSTLLAAFQRRDTVDKLMFGWVQAFQRALPGVSVEKALSIFASHYGLSEADFNIPSQKTRYQRMVREFWEERKTKSHGKDQAAGA